MELETSIYLTGQHLADHLFILNQLFEMEQKTARLDDGGLLARNVQRIKDKYADMGLVYENPVGEPFDETRTDCEAHIAGTSTENLVIKEVIKPIIRFRSGPITRLAQRAVVVVESEPQTTQ